MRDERVLVTGGTGFIAQHCMLALLNAGYRVRTTVRTPARESEVRRHLRTGGIDAGERLTFVTADLNADDGWDSAAAGCTYVLHGASPTLSGNQQSLEDWVRPAVDGNLRVLRAARSSGVRRVVLTSAFGAVGMGHAPVKRPFDESDWTNTDSDSVAPYQKSKTLSERAAWNFIAKEGGGLELATVNPTAVLGPVLGADYSHSIRVVKDMLDGIPGCPKVNSGFVDVRDVADLHLLAMTSPAASGERFLAIAGRSLWLIDVANILRRRLGKAASKVPSTEIADTVVRLGAATHPALKALIPFLGVDMNASSEKAIRLLGWSPRSAEEAIVAAAESLVAHGLLAEQLLSEACCRPFARVDFLAAPYQSSCSRAWVCSIFPRRRNSSTGKRWPSRTNGLRRRPVSKRKCASLETTASSRRNTGSRSTSSSNI